MSALQRASKAESTPQQDKKERADWQAATSLKRGCGGGRMAFSADIVGSSESSTGMNADVRRGDGEPAAAANCVRKASSREDARCLASLANRLMLKTTCMQSHG